VIGLPCQSADGAVLGTIVSVENFGAGDILEIEKPDGKRTMIAFRPGIADLEPERVVVDPAFLA
jgi:16S rRNA processing protein RimM